MTEAQLGAAVGVPGIDVEGELAGAVPELVFDRVGLIGIEGVGFVPLIGVVAVAAFAWRRR